jgi:hypothetical protein
MSFFSYCKGKVKVYCTVSFCDWQSEKLEEYGDAYMELSVHNYNRHRGQFPRWNPNIKAIEKEYRHATSK